MRFLEAAPYWACASRLRKIFGTSVEPWVMPTRVLRAGGGDGIVPERSNCEVYEEGKFATQLRH